MLKTDSANRKRCNVLTAMPSLETNRLVLRNDLAELKRLAEWIEGSAPDRRSTSEHLVCASTLPRRSCRQYHHAWRRKRRTVDMHRSKQHHYSITSSARASRVGGTSRPSEFELVINLKTAKARFLCGQDFQGSKTIGAAGRAANRPRKTPPRG
jgi:hypothetical protein